MSIFLRIAGIIVLAALVFVLGAQRAARWTYCPDCGIRAEDDPDPAGGPVGAAPADQRGAPANAAAGVDGSPGVLEVPAPPNFASVFSGRAPAHADRASLNDLRDAAADADLASTAGEDARDGAQLRPLEARLDFAFRRIGEEDIALSSDPVYPADCLDGAMKEEVVLVRFTVDARGRAVEPVASATTNPCFNEAAISATRRTRFSARSEDGSAPFVAGYIFRKPNKAHPVP